MTKQEMRNKESFVAAILAASQANGKELSYLEAVSAAEYIRRNETTLSRLAEMECDSYFYNRYWKDGVNPKQERTEERIEKYIRETIGCKVHTQRDPRGYCIRLYLKIPETNYFYNTWDGETSAINW